jgi:hypothetical protein
MSILIPNPTQLQTDIEYLNHTLDTVIQSVNVASCMLYDFYNTLWTSLPDSQLSAVLQYMYDNDILYYTLNNYVDSATHLNTVLSAWNINGRYASTLSAGRNFYIDNNTVILLSA